MAEATGAVAGMRARSGARTSLAVNAGCRPGVPASSSDDGAVALDAGPDDLVHGSRPPILREDLDLDEAVEAERLDLAADAAEIDDAAPHHAAIEEKIAGRQEPVADVIGEHALASAASDLFR